MNPPTIYIDGQEGTTALRIRELLDPREDLSLSLIPTADRKNPETRREYLNRADVAVLCLPDEAAGEAVELVDNPDTRIIDTSTARRTAAGWVYGLPELDPGQRHAIQQASRVANPGCYPVGFVLAIRPLIEAGLLDPATQLTVNAVSGYSGGGRKMIEAYQQASAPAVETDAALPLTLYSLHVDHKHLPEMREYSLTEKAPLFVPSVDHTFCGMLVSTPIPSDRLAHPDTDAQDVWQIWQDRYGNEPFVRPVEPGGALELMRQERFLDLGDCNHTNRVDLFVFEQQDRGLILVGRQDNLGKGASGNAVQCLNLMLGLPETTGLTA